MPKLIRVESPARFLILTRTSSSHARWSGALIVLRLWGSPPPNWLSRMRDCRYGSAAPIVTTHALSLAPLWARWRTQRKPTLFSWKKGQDEFLHSSTAIRYRAPLQLKLAFYWVCTDFFRP